MKVVKKRCITHRGVRYCSKNVFLSGSICTIKGTWNEGYVNMVHYSRSKCSLNKPTELPKIYKNIKITVKMISLKYLYYSKSILALIIAPPLSNLHGTPPVLRPRVGAYLEGRVEVMSSLRLPVQVTPEDLGAGGKWMSYRLITCDVRSIWWFLDPLLLYMCA